MTRPILPPILHNWTRFPGIALPEFGRYSKQTHVWMDMSLQCWLLVKAMWCRQKMMTSQGFNVSRLQRRKNRTLFRKELRNQ